MSFIVVIPSRFASTRLQGKPLLDIAGKPMIQHVWERACASKARAVYIATDNEAIKTTAEAFGANVCMTKESHESGTDRLQEVVAALALTDDQVIINVQGDEPLIPPQLIDQLAQLMSSHTQMASLYEGINDMRQVFDPNVVKLVTDHQGDALYFSRAPIPWYREGFHATDAESTDTENNMSMPVGYSYKRHIGIYAYRAKLLNEFVTWPVAPLEAIEKLEQLRVLSQGIKIKLAEAMCEIPPGVDTQADLENVRDIISQY